MAIYNNITELIGRTPIVRISNFEAKTGIVSKLFVKLECMNPLSSSKDRVALSIIDGAEKRGQIKPMATIVEATSGNTGIGLAAVCATRKYKLILTMPETMSIERRKMLAQLGAEIVLTEGKLGMDGACRMAEKIVAETPNSILASQFTNLDNVLAHKTTTAAEIIADFGKTLDFFVAGIGTGGSITGVGEALRAEGLNTKIIAVEPSDSPLLTQGKTGSHGIQGIGANFIPSILNIKILDEIIPIETADAIKYAKLLALTEGACVGISSGAALAAAVIVGRRAENKDKNILVFAPDTGERYISTNLF